MWLQQSEVTSKWLLRVVVKSDGRSGAHTMVGVLVFDSRVVVGGN